MTFPFFLNIVTPSLTLINLFILILNIIWFDYNDLSLCQRISNHYSLILIFLAFISMICHILSHCQRIFNHYSVRLICLYSLQLLLTFILLGFEDLSHFITFSPIFNHWSHKLIYLD